MAKFDEILDEVIIKAKAAADVAGKKTSEVVEYGKLKYKTKQAAWDIEKSYAKLGALVYEARKSEENFDDAIVLAMDELDIQNARLDDLEEKLAEAKRDVIRSNRATAKPPVVDEEPEIFDFADEDEDESKDEDDAL